MILLLYIFSFHFIPLCSCPSSFPVVSVSTCLSVWARQWWSFPARDHSFPLGLMEQKGEYQLKGYKYLRAEIFDNIRVGGPRDS